LHATIIPEPMSNIKYLRHGGGQPLAPIYR